MSAKAMRLWSRSLSLKTFPLTSKLPIFIGILPIDLMVAFGFAVRKVRLLGSIFRSSAASIPDSFREVSVHAVSNKAGGDGLLGGVIVRCIRFSELGLVELAT